MHKRAISRLGVSALAFAFWAWPGASRATGDSLNDALGVRAVAQGEAVRASASGGAATQLNPAGVALTRTYSIEATYGYRGEDDATIAGAAVCDSVTNRVGACVYYNYVSTEPEGGTRTLHDIGLALAVPIAERLMLGVTGRYLDYTETGTQALPEAHDRDSDLVFDAGLILKLAEPLSVAAVGYNIIGHDEDNYPRGIGTGISLALGDKVTIGADGVWNLDVPEGVKTGRYGVGGELFLTGDGGEQGYPLRVGYIYDVLDSKQYFTAGLGFVTPRVAVDAGLRKQVAGDVGDEVMVQFGLRLFMPQ